MLNQLLMFFLGTAVLLIFLALYFLKKKQEKVEKELYELAILRDLGYRIGYSLDIKQIVDVITGSLHQFIDYSMVSYMIIEPDRIFFKVYLEKSVDRGFIDIVKSKMIASLSALLDKNISATNVDEFVSGAILDEKKKHTVSSFFNIPLIIAGKAVGVLTIAHTKAGLYKEEDMNILYKITNQASRAVSRLEEVVNTEQAKLNAMVESMSDGIFMTDQDYKILVANTAVKKIVGVSYHQEINIFDFVDRLGGKIDIKGRLGESIKLKKEFLSERILINNKFYHVFVFPVRSVNLLGEERIFGGAVIFHDVTSQVEIEAIRKDFTSMLVHELRSPLDGIKKITEVLRNKKIELEPANREEYVDLIYKNSSSMLELVNDILDVAKIEAGKFDISKKENDIKKIIEDRVQFYSTFSKYEGVTLSASTSNDLPEKVMFDREGIEHVLSNLLSNAIKYTNQKGTVEVTTFLHKQGRNFDEEARSAGYSSPIGVSGISEKGIEPVIVVLVADTGIGVTEEEKKLIFNKFRQLDTKGRLEKKQKGTGLGLFLAKSIIEEHGGQIGVFSKADSGSTFFFTLPLV